MAVNVPLSRKPADKYSRRDFYGLFRIMSGAFVKEEEGQWLHDVPPTVNALINYLSRENNGIRVYELKRAYNDKEGREVYAMSNGLSYAIDDGGRWYIIW